MSLASRPAYPHPLCYVLKLHRDSNPGVGQLQGVLEHLASGDLIPFHSAAALQAALLVHAAGMRVRQADPDSHPED